MPALTKFKDLGLSDKMIDALRSKGFEEPTPIQALTIPYLLSGSKDVVGQAQTGTGKTGAFGIPLMENINPQAPGVKALVLAPTRELAIQVAEEISSLSLDKSTRVVAVYGGQPIDRQIDRLKRGADIVVGTPGRIIDHIKRKTLKLDKIEYVVLDEADEMLNMGFVEDIEEILRSTPEDKRMLLFSATMPANILRLAKNFMRDYEVVAAKNDVLTKQNINQIYFEVRQSDKFEALYRIIDVEEEFYGVVFCRTKLDVDDITAKLVNRGCRAEALHGDVSQGQREKILQKFKGKKTTVLVATDVAARGIDVDNLTHVINYALPQDPESYVHRIGRTGRAGKKGTAITLVTPSEYRKLMNIQKVANADITKQKVPGVDEVIQSKKDRIKTAISQIIESGHFEDLEEIASEILEGNDAKVAVAALLKHAFKNELTASSYSEISESGGSYDRPRGEGSRGDRFSRSDRPRGDRSRGDDSRGGNRFRNDRSRDDDSRGGNRFRNDRSRDDDSRGDRSRVDRTGTSRLFVAKGEKDGMNPAKLAKFIEGESGVSSGRIRDIKVLDSFSFVEVPFADAENIIASFNKGGGRSLVSKAKDRVKK